MKFTDSLSHSKPGRARKIFILVVIVAVGFLIKFILHLVLPHHDPGSGQPLPLALQSGTFETLYYNGSHKPKGIVILGTGDGGWSYWEEKVAKHLVSKGYAVGGWDCRKFADTRSYDAAELAAGFRAAVKAVQDRSGVSTVPIWYAGWSTGAEQAVAAAAYPGRPLGMVGLLLAAPNRTGRYGIEESDLLGIEPEGEGTFPLAELAPRLTGLKVAQFVAGLDPLDDTTWLAALRSIPHRTYEFPTALHDMGGAGDEFLEKLDQAMAWTLSKH
jgi:hypothetical protein